MEIIKEYVANSFQGWPQNAVTEKIQAEMLDLLERKYLELRAQGVSEDAALGQVIREYGRISQLKNELADNSSYIDADPISPDELQRRHDALKLRQKMFKAYYWVIVTIGYFVLSFSTQAWHVSWLIFLIAVPVEGLIQTILKVEQEDEFEEE